jgi:hypothetical protein
MSPLLVSVRYFVTARKVTETHALTTLLGIASTPVRVYPALLTQPRHRAEKS